MPNPVPAAGTFWTEGFVRDVDTGDICVRVTEGNIALSVSDIEVGAVEIKNATTDDRVIVDTNGAMRVKEQRPSAAARAFVSDNAADVLLLSANASRLGATLTNDSSARLYIGLGTVAASTTSYSASVAQHETWEVPFGYTGEIRGIWASDPNDGACRTTELT